MTEDLTIFYSMQIRELSLWRQEETYCVSRSDFQLVQCHPSILVSYGSHMTSTCREMSGAGQSTVSHWVIILIANQKSQSFEHFFIHFEFFSLRSPIHHRIADNHDGQMDNCRVHQDRFCVMNGTKVNKTEQLNVELHLTHVTQTHTQVSHEGIVSVSSLLLLLFSYARSGASEFVH